MAGVTVWASDSDSDGYVAGLLPMMVLCDGGGVGFNLISLDNHIKAANDIIITQHEYSKFLTQSLNFIFDLL